MQTRPYPHVMKPTPADCLVPIDGKVSARQLGLSVTQNEFWKPLLKIVFPSRTTRVTIEILSTLYWSIEGVSHFTESRDLVSNSKLPRCSVYPIHVSVKHHSVK